MSSRQSSIRTVHTSTVTPAMREARSYMTTAGSLLFAVSLWLFIGLVNCSVNPELSTSADHIFGSVTHYVCSNLINTFGFMSLSITLIMFRLSFMLWSVVLPEFKLKDSALYLAFLIFTATQLQITLGIELMGAPIGGQVGLFIGSFLQSLSPPVAQAISCMTIFGVLGLHTWLYQNEVKAKVGESPEAWINDVHLGAEPIKSLNSEQQRAHDHIFSAVNQLPPEFDKASERFEAVDSFYDDLGEEGLDHQRLNQKSGRQVREPVFQFDFDADHNDEPRLTIEGEFNVDRSKLRTHESTVTPPSTTNPKLISVSAEINMSRSNSSDAYTLGGRSKTPLDHLSQTLNPKVSRETILQRGFDALQITLALTKAESGRVADRYVFISPVPPPLPLYEITERLNSHMKKSLGRSEPSILLTMQNENAKQYVIEATWPRRERKFPETSEAVKIIRELESKGDLTLYLGDDVSGDKAFLPLSELRSIVVTGGERVDQERGLDLVLTNLIYQASPSKLRLLILDVASERSLYSELPHLYSPIINDANRMTQALTWLPIEFRRRKGLMTRLGLKNYEEYHTHSKQTEPRIVLVIPELSSLDNKQQELLVRLIEKLNQFELDTGIHLLMNSRIFGERCAKIVRHVDVHLAFAVNSFEEARGFGVSGAEWLLPENDMLLRVGRKISRAHAWLLPRESYIQILNVLSRASSLNYINSEAQFLSAEHLKGQERLSPSTSKAARSTSQRDSGTYQTVNRQKLSSAHIQRVSESSLPPI